MIKFISILLGICFLNSVVLAYELEPIESMSQQENTSSIFPDQVQQHYSQSSIPFPEVDQQHAIEINEETALIRKFAAKLRLRSGAVAVFDETLGKVVYSKNSSTIMPIASITKLMTAMVVLDAHQPLDEKLTVSTADVDLLRRSASKLPVGAILTREEMLRLALMSSENRAAAALARHYPGGTQAFVAAMNRKAALLGLRDTRFLDSTGLSSGNISTAKDLVAMVKVSYSYPLIRDYTTTPSYRVDFDGRKERGFKNSNTLVRSKAWDIGLSKTGYIKEAGRCLVMQVKIANKPVIIVLLDSWGKRTRVGDANRIKKWMELNFTENRAFKRSIS